MRWIIVLLCYCTYVIVAGVQKDSNSRLVQTTQGPVRGYRDPNGGLFVFYGIPYAQAPTGLNKFKAPLPPTNWSDPLEAVDNRIVCPQDPNFARNKNVQEDCLRANVFVPDTEETNLAVAVYVHGGAFQVGSGTIVLPTHIVKDKNIIVVTFNYRLGVHGFLCLGTSDVPGNAGLKDQVAALRWVKKNIASFGGNPNKITLAGCSAGSISVELLMIADSTKGLFNAVSCESGAGLGPPIVVDPLKNAKAVAKTLNFTNGDDFYALEEFYKTTSLDILTSGPVTDNDHFDGSINFGPCVEREHEEAFLKEDPANIIKKGQYSKVPMLYGFSNMEGLLRKSYFEDWKNLINEKFADFLPFDLQFDNEAQKEEVARRVKEFYFGDKPVGDDTILPWIDYMGDVMFIYPMLRSVKLHAEAGHNKIHLYEYSFVDKDTPVVPHTNVRGAAHCAELDAVMDGQNELNITDEYKHMKRIMRGLWGNFIKTGMPVPPGSNLPIWPLTHGNRAPHMSLTLPPALGGRLLRRRAHMWDYVYARHYRAPIPPPPPPTRHFKHNQ